MKVSLLHFPVWVEQYHKRFLAILEPGERPNGEWIAQMGVTLIT